MKSNIKNSSERHCKIIASDGLPARFVGSWSEEKLFYFEKYINVFTKSMRRIWKGEIYYIDLFAGPGKCIVEKKNKEIDGSPLIALKSPFPFARYFFVEQDEETYKTLCRRYESYSLAERVSSKQGDCNAYMTTSTTSCTLTSCTPNVDFCSTTSCTPNVRFYSTTSCTLI